jgi:hypothetical protein
VANKKTLSVLVLGDIVARIGREAVKQLLPDIIAEKKPDIVIGNVENLAHGKGITERTIEEMKEAGIDIFTSGNHVFSNPGGLELLGDNSLNILRPTNYPKGTPGTGDRIITVGDYSVLVINSMGRIYMNQDLDDPFTAFDEILKKHKNKKYDAVLVDFHAEATSETINMGWYLDGRASAIWGTHTHVTTTDARLLKKKTGYITDVGMTGAYNESLGVSKESTLKTFLTQMQTRHEYPESGEAQLNAIFLTIDTETKNCKTIELIHKLTLV